ncbi:ankyrin repeat-containing domain protein [Aspergillus granulosus]|uniref:Ankyrin repeat-containing domain protein n=1 Tax=Aspergillus granulosus TaxID=176169 RepID=A0ABR4HTP4_9EURO
MPHPSSPTPLMDERPQPTQDSEFESVADLHTRLRTTIDSLVNIWVEGGPNQNEEPRLRRELGALLSNPASSIDFLDPQIGTLILLSAHEADETLFKLLIAHDPNAGPNFECVSNEVLFWAATHGHTSLVERLLEVDGIDPNVMDDYEGETPLSCAAGNDGIDVIRVLLDDERVEIDLCPEWGKGKNGNGKHHTALWWAVWSGKERAARLLRARGAATPRIEGEALICRLLLEAVEKDWVTILEIILETCRKDYATGCGPRGNFRWQFYSNYQRRTLLSLAAETGNVSVLNLLVRYSDNASGGLNPLDVHGRAPIWYAGSKGHDQALRALLPLVDHPRAVDAMDDEGKTPLAEAVEQWTSRRDYPVTQRSRALGRRADAIRQLVAHPMVKTESLGDEQLWVLLGRCVRGGYVEIVEGLAKKDVRVSYESTYFDGCKEKTLIAWAESIQHEELVNLLLEKRESSG